MRQTTEDKADPAGQRLYFWRGAGRGLLLVLVAGLVCVALLRALAGLLEAAALCLLALVVARLALPRGLRRSWRQIRKDVPLWIAQLGEMLVRIVERQQPASQDNSKERSSTS